MIPRGTTPTFTLTFTDEGLDLTEAAHVIVSFRGAGGTVIEKADEDLTIEEKAVSVYLSQAETLALTMGSVAVQVNWTYAAGDRAASNIASVVFDDNLVGRVIE